MTTRMQERVTEQARLLVSFLASLGEKDDPTIALAGTSAELAERLFQGLEELYQDGSEADDASERTAAPHSSAVPRPLTDPTAKRRAYRELVERVRSRVGTYVPAGSTVAVVSRGDAQLVQLPRLMGWHYPQNDVGTWAGYHPATGRDAVDHLEQLRRKGARFLLVPGPSSWWLRFYDELRDHLHVHAHPLVSDADMTLYRLDDDVVAPRRAPTNRYSASVEQFVELAGLVLPADAKLAVVTRGDDAWLSIPGVSAVHFPSTADGTYQGHPADDNDAIRTLVHAIDNGAEYFAVPAPLRWWEQSYTGLWRYLIEVHELIADQTEVGAIFALCDLEAG